MICKQRACNLIAVINLSFAHVTRKFTYLESLGVGAVSDLNYDRCPIDVEVASMSANLAIPFIYSPFRW